MHPVTGFQVVVVHSMLLLLMSRLAASYRRLPILHRFTLRDPPLIRQFYRLVCWQNGRMPTPLAPETLPIDVVARILRTTPSHFRIWLREGPLEVAAGGCRELDALRAALWRNLLDNLGPKAARLAFRDVMDDLQDRLLSGRLDIVYDFANGTAKVCTSDREVARQCLASGHVHALALGDELDRVRHAFRKHLTAQSPTPQPAILSRSTCRASAGRDHGS